MLPVDVDVAVEEEAPASEAPPATEEAAEPSATGLTALQSFAADGATMPLATLEKCLCALGMQKSVLALALEAAGTDAPVDLAAYWSALNPRSAVVINELNLEAVVCRRKVAWACRFL